MPRRGDHSPDPQPEVQAICPPHPGRNKTETGREVVYKELKHFDAQGNVTSVEQVIDYIKVTNQDVCSRCGEPQGEPYEGRG